MGSDQHPLVSTYLHLFPGRYLLLFYCCCSTLLILILLNFISKYYQHPARNPGFKRSLHLPPGPWQLPIIGSIHHLLRGSQSHLPHRSFSRLSHAYGPLMHLKLGQVSVVVASSPEAAEQILKTHDVIFATRPLLTAVKIWTYDGNTISFAPYGEYWRQLRRICILDLLSPKRIRSFRSIREDEVQNLIQSISSSDQYSTVNLSDKFSSMASNIMARAAIGNKYSNDQRRAFLAEVKEAFELSTGFNLADLFPSWSWLVGLVSGLEAKMDRSHRKLDRILDHIIRQHRDKITASTNQEEEEEGINGRQQQGADEDLLDVLLKLQEDGSLEFELTTNRIKAVILDMLGAGTETTSTILEWAMSELMRNPEVMRRAQSEVREALNGKSIVTEADITGLNYLQLVIKETLRLHPPGPLLLPRESQETCEILGYEIPEKARVVINVWAMGRDPQYWDDAESFKPERFEGSPIDFKGTNFEFLPFGSGRRMCPGMSFGLANVELALAQLLYYFNWELPHGIEPHNLDMSECFGVAVSRKSNLCLRSHRHIPCPQAAAA